MKAIGGYFELELASKTNELFHKDFYALNSCRNALLLIITEKGYKKIHVPYYACDKLLEVLHSNNIETVSYSIDSNLEIIDPPKNTQSAILYTNYFALKKSYIEKLSNDYPNVIIDNAQAFFSKPINNADTIYSPRKFFGVPDGGFLFSNKEIHMEKYSLDISNGRISHLIKRIELGPEEGFKDFGINDAKLDQLPIRQMSLFTRKILSQLNYDNISNQRKKNFSYLNNSLAERNLLEFELTPSETPMVYPLLLGTGQLLKNKLIERKVFIPTYWPEVLKKVSVDSFESNLARNLVALPIDQRYDKEDMKSILNLIDNI